jgi:hypothetical protein
MKKEKLFYEAPLAELLPLRIETSILPPKSNREEVTTKETSTNPDKKPPR